MSLFQVVILAIVQGLTEFLPVSSSGHLVIFQNLFGFKETPLAFDVLLHLGSVLAILVFLRKQVFDLIFNWKKNLRLILLILVGSIPAGVFGLLLKKQFEATFSSLRMVGIFYLLTAGLLFSTKFIKNKKEKNLKNIKVLDALLIGLFQAVAILPGVSRSGATIVGSLWKGLSSAAAFNFSFLLAIPAILGASILELPKMFSENGFNLIYLLGLVVSMAVSYFSLSLLEKVLKGKKLFLFGWYCLVLGILLLTNIFCEII